MCIYVYFMCIYPKKMIKQGVAFLPNNKISALVVKWYHFSLHPIIWESKS